MSNECDLGHIVSQNPTETVIHFDRRNIYSLSSTRHITTRAMEISHFHCHRLGARRLGMGF